MRIFLFRHGRSQGQDDPNNYKDRGDPLIGLTDTGWMQAINAGKFLKDWIARHPPPAGARPMRMWSSTHNRCRETSAGVIYGADGLIDKEHEFHVSPLLVEQDFGLYAYIPDPKERQERFQLPFEFYDAAYKQDKYTAAPPMGNAPIDVQKDIYPFIGILMHDAANGVYDAAVVTHGVMLRTLAMAFMKIDPARYKDFDNPENASVYVIEGDGSTYYSFRQIYNGETGQEVDIDWGKKLRAYEANLPEVPERFRNAPVIRPDPAP